MFLLQHHRSVILGTGTAPPQVTQSKACSASKPLQTSGRFSVELVRDSTGFGLTLSGGQDSSGDAPLAVRGLLRNGPAQRCGRLQVRYKTPSTQQCSPNPRPLSGCSLYAHSTIPLSLHSCRLGTSCSTSTENQLGASPTPKWWSAFAQAVPVSVLY